MEAIWKVTRIIGLTCCLGLFAAVSADRADGTVSTSGTAPGLQKAQSLLDVAAALTGQEAQQLLKLLEDLEEHDDIEKVSSNFDISQEDMEAYTA